jgi:hypothetical protein
MVEQSTPFGPWTALLAMVGTLLLLVWTQRWLTRHVQILGLYWVHDPDVALYLYFALVLPGVVIHEMSHWLAALLLGVPASLPSIGPKRHKGQRRGRIVLGSVQTAKVDPLRSSLIGLAPLLGGSALVFIIGRSVLGVEELRQAQDLAAFLAGLGDLLHVPDFWLWLYLIFALSNAMLPSEVDIQPLRPVLIFIGLVTAVVLIVVGLPNIPAVIVEEVNAFAGYLASAFGLTLAVDALFILVVGLLELLTRWLQGRWLST